MAKRPRIAAITRRPEIFAMIESTLRDWDMEVICCSTLAEAHAAIQQRTPDLIFCEDRLVDGDYRDLLDGSNGNSSTPRTRVVVLPGPEALVDPDFVWRALRLGAYAVLGFAPQPANIVWVVLRALREDGRQPLEDALPDAA